MQTPQTVADGLCFGEGPRWHQDKLWFSDMHAGQVLCLDPSTGAAPEVMLSIDDAPSGLGWLPGGDLLVVAMNSRQLLRWDGNKVRTHADLSQLASWHCNDMVVDAQGSAWVGNFGFDLHAGGSPQPAELIRVDSNGSAAVAAIDLMFPNGAVITPDGATLVVAETFASRLTAFDFAPDNSLGNRREWATLPKGVVPDGICLDAEGCIWVASPTSNDVLRVAEGGEIKQRVQLDRGAFACMLNRDPAKPILYILAAKTSDPKKCQEQRSGQVLAVPAPAAGAGWP